MASPWDELNAKYGTPAQAADTGGSDAWAELNAKYSAPTSAAAASATTSAAPAKAKEVGLLDQVRAGMTGINKGFFSDLLGLPVDTMQNVVDISKAGVGTVATMAGRPDLAPNINMDRSGVVGSSDWIGKKINQGTQAVGMESPINNPNPQDTASRVLHTGGRFAGSSVVPSSRLALSGRQQAVNAGMGTVSGVAAGAVGEVAPEYAGLAGMAPSMAARSSADIVRLLSQGGEAGRQNTAQRVQDFKNAGVDNPSAGMATGNKLMQGLENLLGVTPGSMDVIGKNRLAMMLGIQDKADTLRNNVSSVYGAAEAGTGIQRDLKGPFKERISSTYGLLNDKVEQAVGANTAIPVNESIGATNRLTSLIPGAEATSSNFVNSRIAKIGKDLTADAGGKPATSTPSTVLGEDGKPAFMTTTPATNPQGVPFSAVKNVRTRIGQEAASSEIMGTPQQGEFKQLYGALSQDMKTGVAMADLLNGTKGLQALERANKYYSNAMARAEAMGPIANRSTPEGAYNSVAGSLNAGPTTYGRVRNAVSTDTRQKVVATVIDDMGRATPGQQNADGTEWSAKTFITNYNKVDPEARKALFKRLPGGVQYESDLKDIAKAADMINQGAKQWANPSGTGAALAARGTFSALTVGAFYQPMWAAGTAGGLIAGHAMSRLLTSPKFVNWLAKAPQVNPEEARSYAQRIMTSARLSGDKQFEQDVTEYLQSVQQGAQELE